MCLCKLCCAATCTYTVTSNVNLTYRTICVAAPLKFRLILLEHITYVSHFLTVIRPRKKTNKTLFYGRKDLPSIVSQLGFFFFFFLLAKIIQKMQTFRKKSDIFAEKFWETFWLIFLISAKILRFWSKNSWFYKNFKNFLKKICQNGKFGRSHP